VTAMSCASSSSKGKRNSKEKKRNIKSRKIDKRKILVPKMFYNITHGMEKLFQFLFLTLISSLILI